MNPVKNPFAPGAGTRPPELVGRDEVLTEANTLLGRIKEGRPEKSILLTGLRGVGKTVLLNEMEHAAEELGYQTLKIEAHEDKALGQLLIPSLRGLLFKLDRMELAKEKVKRGFAVLRGFVGALKVKFNDVEFGIDIEPEKGAADSGDLEADLGELFAVVAEAAKDSRAVVAILIDEIQYLDETELSALIMAMHRMQQEQFPLLLLGAGLPILPKLAGESKSYAERLFSFPNIGALSKDDAKKALQEPVNVVDVQFEDDALEEIFNLTQGYPYFIQEWGYQSWNHAESTPITREIVLRATRKVIQRLDANFFRVRFDRLTTKEKEFLRAMAELGAGNNRTADIADALGIKIHSLGPMRAQLMKKGMIYSPVHGELAFTVPLFDEFMKRAIRPKKSDSEQGQLL